MHAYTYTYAYMYIQKQVKRKRVPEVERFRSRTGAAFRAWARRLTEKPHPRQFTPWLHRVVADHLSDRNAFVDKNLCFWFANDAYACHDEEAEAENNDVVVESPENVDDDENRNRGALSKADDDVAMITRL